MLHAHFGLAGGSVIREPVILQVPRMMEESPSQLEASGFTLVMEEGMENGTQALKYTAHISWTKPSHMTMPNIKGGRKYNCPMYLEGEENQVMGVSNVYHNYLRISA